MNIDQSNYHYCTVCMYVVITTLLVLPGSLSTHVCENVYTPTPHPSKTFPIFAISESIHHLSSHYLLIFIILHLPVGTIPFQSETFYNSDPVPHTYTHTTLDVTCLFVCRTWEDIMPWSTLTAKHIS